MLLHNIVYTVTTTYAVLCIISCLGLSILHAIIVTHDKYSNINLQNCMILHKWIPPSNELSAISQVTR